MIVILKHNTSEEKRRQLIDWLQSQQLGVHVSVGAYHTVLGLIGDTSRVDMDLIRSLDIVESVKQVSDPFKCCNRKFHPEDTVIEVGDVKIGGGNFCMIAGPCSVERLSPWRRPSKRQARTCCAAARSSRAPRPTPFRA